MPEKVEFLDCCSQPVVKTLRALKRTSHEMESIRRCLHCNQYWYYLLLEQETREDTPDRKGWWVKLTSAEAEPMLASKEKPDLTLLNDKPGIVKDSEGIKRVVGRPDFF